MKLPSAISSFIYKCDFFSTKVGFRFKEEREYASLTGGIASILMICIFMGIFTKTGINTLNKEYIVTEEKRKMNDDPSLVELNRDNKFYFITGLNGIDMNSGIRYFDITLTYTTQIVTTNSSKKIKSKVPLVPCKLQTWAALGIDSVYRSVQSLSPQKWLCPPQNDTIQLRGKFTSENFQYIKIAVQKCVPEADPNRRCATPAQISSYLKKNQAFTINYYFVNTILNPGQQDHIKHYLEDKNYFPFTLTQGLTANIFVSQYSVKTDQSLIPLEDVTELTGGIVNQDTQYFPFYITGNEYIKFYLRKSNQQILIDRSFRKIDDTLSYIGGLFSTLIAGLAIVCFYNELSYELEIAKTIYRYDEDTSLDTNGFHFLSYLIYLFYMFLKIFGCEPNWTKMERYDKSFIEVRKQMDVRLIFKKILFTQKLAAALLKPEQLTALHLQDKITINTAEEIRQNYFLPKLLIREISQRKKVLKTRRALKNQAENDQVASRVFSQDLKDCKNSINLQQSTANNLVKDTIEENQSNAGNEVLSNTVSAVTFIGKSGKLYSKTVLVIRELMDLDAQGDEISKKILNGISPEIKQILDIECELSSEKKDVNEFQLESGEFQNINMDQRLKIKRRTESHDCLKNYDNFESRTEGRQKNSQILKKKIISLQNLNLEKPSSRIKFKEIKDVILVDDYTPSLHEQCIRNPSLESSGQKQKDHQNSDQTH